MDARLQILRRLANQGDVEATTRLAFWELNLFGDRADAHLARRIAELINGMAIQQTIWWLGGDWKGYPAFISMRTVPPTWKVINPPGIRPGSDYVSDLFDVYFSMRSPLNVNHFMFFRILGVPETPPDRLLTELSGHGSGAIYGASVYPEPDPNRTYDFFEHQQEVQRYWFQHPEDLLDRMAARIAEMDEDKEQARIARERWALGLEEDDGEDE